MSNWRSCRGASTPTTTSSCVPVLASWRCASRRGARLCRAGACSSSMRRLAVMLLLGAWAAGCAPKGPQRPPEVEALLHKVERDPNDAEAFLEMARLSLRQRDLLRARQYLAVAERSPN